LYSTIYSFKGWQNNKNHAFPFKRCTSNEKTCYCCTFYNENHTYVLYITCNKKILFVQNILAYCGWSPTSPFFFLLSEPKHCDNVATNSNSENAARSRIVASLRGSLDMGQRMMSQVLGAFGLLDVTVLLPVLAWRAFLKLWIVCFFNFPIFFFSGRGQPLIRRSTCILNFDLPALLSSRSSQYFPSYVTPCGSVYLKYDYILPKVGSKVLR
jgi:hypothetical protein